MLTAVLTATNARLHGVSFLLALALSAAGVLLLVEAASRESAARPVPFWIVGGALLLAGLALGVQPGRGGSTPRNPLRVVFTPAAQADFGVAFSGDIGVPAPSDGWTALHVRGGTDVGQSTFRFTFANRSDVPLSISDVHAEVLGSVSPPTGSYAKVYTQGDQPLEKFLVLLDNAAARSTAPVYHAKADGGWDRTPFFGTHDISLQPGEIYQGAVTVRAWVPGALRYRFVVAGQTPNASFLTTIPGVYEISGRPGDWNNYEHNYWNLDECRQGSGHPWVRVSTYAQYLISPYPGCPGASWTRAGSK